VTPTLLESGDFRKGIIVDTALEGYKTRLVREGTATAPINLIEFIDLANKTQKATANSPRNINTIADPKARTFLLDKVLIPNELSKDLIGSVLDFAETKPELSTAVELLKKLGLDEELKEGFKGTAYIPTNEAFDAAAATLEGLTDEQVKELVQYHIGGKAITAKDFKGATTYSLKGLAYKLATDVDTKEFVVNNAVCKWAQVGQASVCILNRVLSPIRTDRPFRSALDAVVGTPELSTLASVASKFPAVVELLGRDFVGTLFAPSNKAFEDKAVAAAIPTLTEDQLLNILKYHVTTDKVVRGFNFNKLKPNKVATILGPELTLSGSSTKPTVNDIKGKLLKATGLGIVYVIDKVLLPPAPADSAPGTPGTPGTPPARRLLK